METHHELPCVNCGYSLRGLGVDARCPECGKRVRETIAAQTLASWPIEWLRQLGFGLKLLMLGLAIGWLETFRWLAAIVVFFEAFDVFTFWPVITWLPIRTPRSWWTTLAITDSFILIGRFGMLTVGVLALRLLWLYSRRLRVVRDVQLGLAVTPGR